MKFFPLLSIGIWSRSDEAPPEKLADREPRRAVWIALSELYLDAVLSEIMMQSIASTLAASAYSLGQLEEILYFEVHPVLASNLLSVAGEWSHFDPSWLEEKILKKKSSTRNFAIVRLAKMIWPEWQKLQLLITECRTEELQSKKSPSEELLARKSLLAALLNRAIIIAKSSSAHVE